MQAEDESADQREAEDSSPSAAAPDANIAEQVAPVQDSDQQSVQVPDQQSDMAQPVQEAEAGSVAAVLATLSEGKVEAAPGQTHAEVLMAEQAQTAEAMQQSSDDGSDSSAVDGHPAGIVIELDQYEPTAEEDASQHIQLEQMEVDSEIDQPVQPDSEVDNAVVHNDADAADGTQTGSVEV